MNQIKIGIIAICTISLLFTGIYGYRRESPYLKKHQYTQDYHYVQNQTNNTSQTRCNPVNLTDYNGITLSGYLNVAENSSSALGFIFYGAKGRDSSEIAHIPTIIWLSGGPGVTSQSANLVQNGPLFVKMNDDGETFTFTENPESWTNEYNVLFMDQPISTGISFAADESEIPKTSEEVAEHLYYALTELYKNANGCFNLYGLQPEITPLFIYGDSYSGKFVPAIGEKIMKEGNKLNLIGIGMLNGFTATFKTIEAVNDFSFDQQFISIDNYYDNKLIIEELKQAMEEEDWMKAKLLEEKVLNATNPNNIYIYNIDVGSLNDLTPKNTTDDSGNKGMDYYHLFNSTYGRQLFNLTLHEEFQALSSKVFEVLIYDYMKDNIVEKVEYLLEQNVFVHVASGNLDLVVPHYAQQRWIAELKWKDIEGYKKEPVKILREGKQIIGSSQSFQNLVYNIVFDAGHGIPFDQPERMNIVLKQAIMQALIRSEYIQV